MEDIRLELFTVAEIKEWLIHNRPVRGLSDELMSKTRAYSIIHDPYAEDDMYVISALFVKGKVAAYTSVFPERMARPERLVYWDTTLYVAPEFEGKGYGAIVIGQICEQYGDAYFDHAAAAASVQNFKFLKLPVAYVSEYVLGSKSFDKSFKGRALKRFWDAKGMRARKEAKKRLMTLADKSCQVEYVGYVDDELYGFIRCHSEGDAFLRTQDSFNWILRYPFSIEAPLMRRVVKENSFSAFSSDYSIYAVKVIQSGVLIGFYVFKMERGRMTVKYLYYDQSYERTVFNTIFEHVCAMNASEFHTYSPQLVDYMQSLNYYQKRMEYKVSFTYPNSYEPPKYLRLQAGDGDMFS